MPRTLMVLPILAGAVMVLGAISSVPYQGPRPSTTVVPELVEPGVISTGLDELNAAISPDGREMYFSVNAPGNGFGMIVVSHERNGRWGEPETVPFSGRYTDYDPFFHPDGSRLFFISNRPAPGKESTSGDFDIWMVRRTADGWSEAENIGTPVNTPGAEYYPSVTRDGTLYFSARRDGGQGSFDIYRSRLVDGAYSEPENLGPTVNKSSAEIDVYVAPDESFIVLAGYGRDDSMGGGDLYISYRTADGGWTESTNLGPVVNSSSREYCPIGSPDGQFFYWTSKRGFTDDARAGRLTYRALRDSLTGIRNGEGNIYRVPMSAIHHARP